MNLHRSLMLRKLTILPYALQALPNSSLHAQRSGCGLKALESVDVGVFRITPDILIIVSEPFLSLEDILLANECETFAAKHIAYQYVLSR